MPKKGEPTVCTVCGVTYIPKNGSSPNLFCSKWCRGLHTARTTHPLLDERFFENIDRVDKAYWLGFVFADGCLTARGKGEIKSLTFSLKSALKDEDQLDRFIQAVNANPDKKGLVVTKKGAKTYQCVEIKIGNRVFCEGLTAAGLQVRKSLTVRVPNLGERNLTVAFLAGYYDGNGTLSGNSPTLFSGSRLFLEDISSIFEISNKIRKSKRAECYSISLGLNVHDLMMETCPESMARKRRGYDRSRFQAISTEGVTVTGHVGV